MNRAELIFGDKVLQLRFSNDNSQFTACAQYAAILKLESTDCQENSNMVLLAGKNITLFHTASGQYSIYSPSWGSTIVDNFISTCDCMHAPTYRRELNTPFFEVHRLERNYLNLYSLGWLYGVLNNSLIKRDGISLRWHYPLHCHWWILLSAYAFSLWNYIAMTLLPSSSIPYSIGSKFTTITVWSLLEPHK